MLVLASCAPLAAAPQPTAPPPTPDLGSEESLVRSLVESFGQQLKVPSLQATDAESQIRRHYSGYVSAELLDAWARDLSHAPGRAVSSPWPDRIEVTSVKQQEPGKYSVDGTIWMVTSVEMVKGGAFEKIPVHLTVQNIQGRWLITEYKER